jgi:peptidoglycan/LPS O-acetylase OafA/YrhL
MGVMRLALALAVLVSHAGLRARGLNPGVSAVIGFYLISGYVMTGLMRRHYASAGRVAAFYADRLLRILPQYLLYAGVTLVWFVVTGTRTTFLTRSPDALDLLNNLTVVPLNFFMFNGADQFTLIPPAWSLGAELQFYLLMPLLVLRPRLGAVLVAGSLGVHAAALVGRLHADWFGYRLLAGVLWVFGAGMLLFVLQRARARWADALAIAAPVLALVIYLVLRARGLHAVPYNQEVLIGWGFGVPLLHWLSRRPSGRLDTLAGDLSYGVFLNHFLLIWCLQPLLGSFGGVDLLALIAASLLLSALTQRLVERPALAWRRRLRLSSVP